MQDQEKLNQLRHSAAHLLAASVLELWPGTHNAIGPAIENGFYQDFDFGDVKITEDDLVKIEQKMRQLIEEWDDFQIKEVPIEQAKKDFAHNPYKSELIEDFAKEGKTITETKQGDFLDLCKGGHSGNLKKELGAFKLTHLAGAYWRGSEKNKMLTRIYGTAFSSQKELEDHLNLLEEAKKRDHRKLGKELGLFVFSDLVGAGLPMFTPKGTILRDQLLGFSEKLQLSRGFMKVWIPHITKIDLYKKSGHWDKFGDELFLVKSQETDDQFALKPMNCPHHTQIYASQMRSYKDLPLRYMETTTQYRDEKAGELSGLSRVRSLTVDDAHIFCRMDQIENEFENIMQMIKEMYEALGMKFKARLSFRDETDKYLGEQKLWDEAQAIIERVAQKLGLDYFIGKGEAAFYGPKIDIMVFDSLGRQWQCATQQLDFVQPERFGLKYTDSDGSEKTPVMLHKALLGSVERFLSVYIEHTAGAFPVWLAPIQIQIVPIAERHNEYAQKLLEQLKNSGIRAEVDNKQETMQLRIRNAEMQKIPYILVVGDREEKDQTVAVRKRGSRESPVMKFADFAKSINEAIESKSLI